ncbi:MAG TPA: amidohydrolase, partial [Nannocystis sp.]
MFRPRVVRLLAPLSLLFACTPRPAAQPPPVAHEPGVPPTPVTAAKVGSKSAEGPKWDVNDPPGEELEVTIDVREGTWMNVDISPDGTEIAFDLLGDLYTLPITGGEARALTSGMAWDMQPRYSPDGRFIAFTSDRGGGDNIWVIPRAGGEPRQITKEDFRLLNSPVWSPDGNFIAARKHFTKHRSLGSGEIWLYHVSGGKGVAMTEKPNDQKDVGEPAFSPDGKYVYFSQDTTPGRYFEYNKDPYAGIYTIRRLERATGRIEDLVGGAFGAVRPTPSHDGKLLAYVRRLGATPTDPGGSALHVRDLQSGQERVLVRGLERDHQETWAIHGVYPAMAFTPDDKAIVYWSGGTLHRVEVATGTVTDIPFHVKSTRKVTPALRYPVKVAPPEFPVKMLRWATVSPDGKTVVYQALGKLYVKTLPNG